MDKYAWLLGFAVLLSIVFFMGDYMGTGALVLYILLLIFGGSAAAAYMEDA